MPLFALIFWKFFGQKNQRIPFSVVALGIFVVLCGAYLIPGISARVTEGAGEVQSYFSRNGGWSPGDYIGSLDTRLDMWAAGLEAFRSAPLFGLGFPGFNEFLHHRIEMGLSHPELEIIGFKHLHSEIITTAAKLGLMGIFALAALWVGGIRWFLSGAKESKLNGMVFRVMGLITFTAMITYSMTDSMFGMTLHAMVYTLFLGISAGGLRHAELNSESRSAIG
jgi:O-antigen ligase